MTKISIAAYGRIRDRYALLRAGGAAGFGVGPIVVARSARTVGGRVAIPGERTTAALLLTPAGPLRDGADAVRSDRAGSAARRRGLRRADSRGPFHVSGEGSDAAGGSRQPCGKQRMKCPLPLAAIAIRRDLVAAHGSEIDRALRASVEYAFAHPGRQPRSMSANTRRRWMPRSSRSTSSSTSTTTPSRSTNARCMRCSTGSRRQRLGRYGRLHCRSLSDFLLSTFHFYFQMSSSSGTAYALGTRLTTMVRPNSTSTVAASDTEIDAGTDWRSQAPRRRERCSRSRSPAPAPTPHREPSATSTDSRET